jgi:hypothetical protein
LLLVPVTCTTGADLVYVRRDPDAFALVQYKLLQQLKDGRLVFRPDGRLDNQVTRMLSLETCHEATCPQTTSTPTGLVKNSLS